MYFDNCHTDKELKQRYRYLAKQLHPDKNNGDDSQFKKMKSEYDKRCNKNNKQETKRTNYEKEYIHDVMQQVQRFQTEVINPIKGAWNCFNDILKKL